VTQLAETRRACGCLDASGVWRREHSFARSAHCMRCGISRDEFIQFLADLAERQRTPPAGGVSVKGGTALQSRGGR
jgi:hypothetical protein